MPIPAALAAMGSAASVAAPLVAGYIGQGRTNKTNMRLAREQMAFQERMRNTEWQAAVADMEKAGLNPALAYGHGGASSPQGAMAEAGDSVASALSSKAQLASIKNMSEQNKLLKAQQQTEQARAVGQRWSNQLAQYETRMKEANFGMYFQPDPRNPGRLRFTPRMNELLNSQHDATIANNARASSQLRLSEFSEKEAEAIAALFNMGGGSGAIPAVQRFLPAILSLLRGR